jgi:hypothetical protein
MLANVTTEVMSRAWTRREARCLRGTRRLVVRTAGFVPSKANTVRHLLTFALGCSDAWTLSLVERFLCCRFDNCSRHWYLDCMKANSVESDKREGQGALAALLALQDLQPRKVDTNHEQCIGTRGGSPTQQFAEGAE